MSRSTPWLAALSAFCSVALALANDFDPPTEPSSATSGIDSSRAQITGIKIGFDGAYKLGHWTPLAIAIHAGDEDLQGYLEVQTLDGDAAPSLVRGPELQLAAGQQQTVSMLFKPGRPQAPLIVRLLDPHAKPLHERTFADTDVPKALLATQSLMVELGGSIGLEPIGKLYEADHPEKVVSVAGHIRALPEKWLGYEGADAVVISTSDAKLQHDWSAERVAALDHWVRMGGAMILCVGREGESVLAGDAPLARFAPGEFDSVVSRGPGAWESFASALAEPMTARGGGRAQPIRTTTLKNVRGQIEHSDGTIPLVVRTPHGFGTVTFVAADLDQPPFSDWSARGKLLLRLLQRQDPSSEGTAARESAALSTRLGYTDVSGQLRAALDRFGGVGVVSFFVVALLGLGYLLLLFPLEYLLVRRGARFAFTWITFPLLLAGAVTCIWWFAERSKGDQIRVNRIDIVDIDLAGGDVRGSTFFGLYSPATQKYKLSIRPNHSAAGGDDTRLSWLGLPGTGLGGMNSTVVNASQFDRPYLFGGDRIEGLPLAQWSSKSFRVAWGFSADDSRGSASPGQPQEFDSGSFLGERAADRQPLGGMVNDSGIDLRDCVLFYAGWAYPLGDLQGQSSPNGSRPARVQVERPGRGMTIHGFLTERRVMEDKEQSTPYDPASDDAARIARMLMFHDSAGGRRYTGLSSRYLDTLDMTPLLRLGQAVLLARGPAATTLDIRSGDAAAAFTDESLAFYRFVIPVRRGLPPDDAQHATARLALPSAEANTDSSQ